MQADKITVTEAEIETKIIETVAENLNIDKSKISRESNFVDDLGADSLALVEFVMALEEAFGVEIPDADAAKIKTVDDAIIYVKTKRAF